jgi:hypothetical protein
MRPENPPNDFTDRPRMQKSNSAMLLGFQEQNMLPTDELTSQNGLKSEKTNERYRVRTSAN